MKPSVAGLSQPSNWSFLRMSKLDLTCRWRAQGLHNLAVPLWNKR